MDVFFNRCEYFNRREAERVRERAIHEIRPLPAPLCISELISLSIIEWETLINFICRLFLHLFTPRCRIPVVNLWRADCSEHDNQIPWAWHRLWCEVNSWASHPNVHKMQIDTCGYMDEYICLETLMETVRFCGPMALRFWLYLFLPVPFVQYYTYTLNAAIHKGFRNAMSSTMKTIISFWSWNKLWCM